MFGKNRKKTVGLCVMVVTSCFILAALWAVLATPETALAHKTGEKHNHSGGGGGEAGLVTVTRENDSEWTIEAGVDDKAAVIHTGSKITAGFVSMPFLITVEILP